MSRLPTHLFASLILSGVTFGQQIGHQSELGPSPPVPVARFGDSLSLDGSILVVGAWRESFAGETRGAAYVFRRDASGVFAQEQRLARTVLSNFTGHFGHAVSTDAGRILVSGDGSSTADEYAVVYEWNAQLGWTEQDRLEHPTPWTTGGTTFGWASSLSGDLAVIGAPYDQNSSQLHTGSAYAFRYGAGGWVFESALEAFDGGVGNNFGRSVAASGEWVVVGAIIAGSGAGSAYVFRSTANGWSTLGHLPFPQSGSPADYRGWCVATDGDWIFVGAPATDNGPNNNTGVVFAFQRQAGSWLYSQTIAPVTEAPIGGYGFGVSVDVSGDLLSVGTLDGDEAQLFRLVGGVWTPAGFLRLEPGSASPGGLGQRVTVDGQTVVAAAPLNNEILAQMGRAYVFDLAGTVTDLCPNPPNSTGSPADLQVWGPIGLAANDLVLVAQSVPDEFGLVVMGTNRDTIPLGTGTLCVGFPFHRSAATLASGNVLSVPLDFGNLPPGAGPIAPGETWYFQAWHRDPSGPPGFGLSNALGIAFVP